MKTRKIRPSFRGIEFMLLIFTVLITLSSNAVSEPIPSERRIQWDPGVRGGIPTRTTICANVKAPPYNAMGDGISDDTSAIVNAINACPVGQVVYIPTGTYKVTSSISIKSGITVRGEGIGNTIIRGSSIKGEDIIGFHGAYSWNLSSSPSRNISGSLNKGSTSLTTVLSHGWIVGDVILIDQVNNELADPPVNANGTYGGCTWCGRPLTGPTTTIRSFGQMNKVVATPTPATATLETPLFFDYDAEQTPQATRVDGITKNAGLEAITVDNSLSSGSPDTAILMAAVSNSWLLHVEVVGSWKQGIRLYSAYHNTIKSSKIHEGIPATATCGTQYGPSRGYGIWFNPWASSNLIEDNEFYHLSSALQLNGVTSGNVIAYNYISPMYYICEGSDFARQAIGFHGSHPMMNLFEGNWVEDGIIGDFGWGSSSHQTFFRNRAHSQTGKTQMVWNIDLNQKHHYFNIVGNILGTNGNESEFELESKNFINGTKAIYRLGYTELNDENASENDVQVKASLLRHGNWDSVTQSTIWDIGIADRTLPNSYYLSSKPSFFGSCPWPSIGPDLSPRTQTHPAKDRFDGKSTCSPPEIPTKLIISSPPFQE